MRTSRASDRGSERSEQLHATADRQIADLIALLATADGATLRRPCPGRGKLGDGTFGALASHTADNYQRIGRFLATADGMSAAHAAGEPVGHRTPRFLRALGHQPTAQSRHLPQEHGHDDRYTAENARPVELVQQLSGVREQLSRIAQLTDRQLDSVPPKDSFRFCDGQRTLEQVITGLLKHQDQQLRALKGP